MEVCGYCCPADRYEMEHAFIELEAMVQRSLLPMCRPTMHPLGRLYHQVCWRGLGRSCKRRGTLGRIYALRYCCKLRSIWFPSLFFNICVYFAAPGFIMCRCCLHIIPEVRLGVIAGACPCEPLSIYLPLTVTAHI